jgi:hypothetical protein
MIEERFSRMLPARFIMEMKQARMQKEPGTRA